MKPDWSKVIDLLHTITGVSNGALWSSSGSSPLKPESENDPEASLASTFYTYENVNREAASLTMLSEKIGKETNDRELYKASGRMETGRAINSIPLLVPKERLSMEKRKTREPTCSHEVHGMESGKKNYVEWNDVGQPVGSGGRSIRTFLGTVARNASKLPIDISVWNKMPKHLIEDVWDFIKGKYDVGELEKKWIMKDISQKWKYHKYALRRKFFKQSTQTFTDIRKAELRKSRQEMDRSELFIVTHTRKDGIPVNSECAVAITHFVIPRHRISEREAIASKRVQSV
ncbi:hypothetical protein Taro_042768 [Colocasia esculenta]|uniref:Uncharacterized protein n=1 Tax=Colocasia esculenta TaxID=4460 RepID=A0A843WPQ7_COLES|nr:hypothetical protein [Colocasia esculenta]